MKSQFEKPARFATAGSAMLLLTSAIGAASPRPANVAPGYHLLRLRPLVAGPQLTIDPTAGRHTISHNIYGVTIFWNPANANYAAFTAFAQQIKLQVNREGGDATTRYNWNVDSSNPGSDFFFTAGNGQTTVTPGASVDAIVTANRSVGAASIITIPIIDDINNSAAFHCSYPSNAYPPQLAYNPYIHPGGVNCGDGVYVSNGTNILDTNILSHDIQNTTATQQSWVSHFVTKYGQAAQGGVGIYQLDNEPNGWIGVHHDVRPQNIGYGELLQKSIAYAQAIKAADPTASVLGPGDIAPADGGCNGGGVPGTCTNDSVPHSEPLGLYYLQAFAQHTPRLLDYYAMHYPGSCCFATNGTLDDMVAAITRHKSWIAQAYPGTKLAYDEWNRGTGNGFGNALATADGLGIFGAYGVDLASFWGLDDPSYPSAYAFRMFRNFDGQGGRFAGTSVSATSADRTQLTVYAAQRWIDRALTILVVNSTGNALTSSLNIAHTSVVQPVLVYQYSAANPSAIVQLPSIAPQPALATTFAPQSLTMLVVPSGTTPLRRDSWRFER